MTNKKKKAGITNIRNIVLSAAMLLISVGGYLYTYFGSGWSKKTGEAAKMFPRIVLILLAIIAVVLILKELSGRADPEPAAITVVKFWQVILMIALTSLFFLFVIHVGVASGILIFLVVMIALFDEELRKNWYKDLIVAVVATGVLYLIFMKVLPIIRLHSVII